MMNCSEEQEQANSFPGGASRASPTSLSSQLIAHRTCRSFTQARIKKIMQKDDEVGKVAQATPIVICESAVCCPVLRPARIVADADSVGCVFTAKALELFMADLVQEASNITIQRGAKRLEAYHL
jgi:hypothetical protein